MALFGRCSNQDKANVQNQVVEVLVVVLVQFLEDRCLAKATKQLVHEVANQFLIQKCLDVRPLPEKHKALNDNREKSFDANQYLVRARRDEPVAECIILAEEEVDTLHDLLLQLVDLVVKRLEARRLNHRARPGRIR